MEVSICNLVMLFPFGIMIAYFLLRLIVKGAQILKGNLDKLAFRSFIFRSFKLPVEVYGCLIVLFAVIAITYLTPQVTIVACDEKSKSSAVASATNLEPAFILASLGEKCQCEEDKEFF